MTCSLAPSVLAALSRSGSTPRTPWMACSRIRKNPAYQMMKILPASCVPNHKTASGIHANGMTKRNDSTSGSNSSQIRLDRPRSTPSGMAVSAARRNPRATRRRLTSSAGISTSDCASETPLLMTFEIGGRITGFTPSATARYQGIRRPPITPMAPSQTPRHRRAALPRLDMDGIRHEPALHADECPIQEIADGADHEHSADHETRAKRHLGVVHHVPDPGLRRDHLGDDP